MPTGPKGSISSPRWSTRGLRTRKSVPGQGRLTRIYVEFLNRFSQMIVLFWRFECSDKTDNITNKHYNSNPYKPCAPVRFPRYGDQQRHQKSGWENPQNTSNPKTTEIFFAGEGRGILMLLIATFRASKPVQDSCAPVSRNNCCFWVLSDKNLNRRRVIDSFSTELRPASLDRIH